MFKDRDRRPQEIEVKVRHPKLRLAAAILLVAVGLAAIGYGLTALLEGDDGWMEMTVDSASKENCGADFRLEMDLSGASSAARKQLSLVYTQASEEAYALFHTGKSFEGIANLYEISQRPGETLTVPPALYRALELAQADGARWLYLAPVYQVYQSLFYAAEDREALDYAPRRSREVREFVDQALAFCRDPAHVNLDLLGENRVRLTVSPEYRAFARENQISGYLDFFWMKNAFITDYLADALRDAGFTRGLLTSKDGFAACLDDSGRAYTLTVYHREGRQQNPVAVVGVDRPVRTVALRDAPLADGGMTDLYYRWEDGEITTPYVSWTDGLDHAAAPEVLACSFEKSCGEIALALAPLYISEDWDPAGVDALTAQGVWSVYWAGEGPRLNDPAAARLVVAESP